jgi:hypothetical protein
MNVLQENPKDSMNRWPCRKDEKILSPEQFKNGNNSKPSAKENARTARKKSRQDAEA